MSKNSYTFLIDHFASYEIVYSEIKDCVEIINPFGKYNIIVDYDSADFTPFSVMFSFQHRHFKDENDVFEYIEDIIGENVFAIEFFKDGNDRFGGDITLEQLNNLSYKALEQITGYYGSTKLKDCADSFKVRGWSGNKDFDAAFVTLKNGEVEIKKD